MTPRPLIDILREHRRGQTLETLDELLHDLTSGVAEANKKGELTIKITLKPAGEQGALSLMIDPVLKLPKEPPGESLYFVSPENNLTKQSPQQILDLPGAPGPHLAHKGIA